jgi:L-fucose isomerase-like protein
MYATPAPKKMTSWKSWGGVQTEEAAHAEAVRIQGELEAISARAGFAIEAMPVLQVTSVEAAVKAAAAPADVRVIYPATGSGNMLRAAIGQDSNAVIFLRHRSGPVYYWYEALSVRYLKPESAAAADAADARMLTVDDVVVDDSQELLRRLRAFYAIRNFHGSRIVALGGAQGKYAPEAVQVSRERFRLEIIEFPYSDFESRLRGALRSSTVMAQAERWTDHYLSIPNTRLETERKFVVNSFVLYGCFKELMREAQASAFTIHSCMGTIMPMAETTACLTLSLLNDEGLLAFCESDFVIIPAGIFLRHLSGKPVFLHNSTFPHRGIVTCAHCSAPRRMDGSRYEPARLLTHYESEFGAAPKVEMPKGQAVTFINPEYTTGRWVGMRGVVEDNPFYEICRSQQDVRILGNWRELLNEVRDSHWVMAYGDYLDEIGYAARRLGVVWRPLAASMS